MSDPRHVLRLGNALIVANRTFRILDWIAEPHGTWALILVLIALVVLAAFLVTPAG